MTCTTRRAYTARLVWVIDPLHEAITLTELLLGDAGVYEFGVHTADVFTTDRPWPVTLDLPAFTARRAQLLAAQPA